MQQGATVTWEPVVQTSQLKTWHIIVAALLFALVIYGTVWWTRRRSERNPGSLRLHEDDPDTSEQS
jgi:membrane protein DedA with SNARE-associated domain